MDLFRKTMKPVEQVPKDANVKKDVDEGIVGGYSRIPKVQQLLKEFFGGKEPPKISTPTRPLHMVLLFKVVFYRVKLVVKISSLLMFALLPSVIETTGGVFTKLIPCNTVVPSCKSQM
jgi:heat shock protein 5